MRFREDVIALGDTTAGGLLWRVGGRLHMTVVVKATFGLVQAERMTARAPQPIHGEDVHLASGAGVVAPSDVAPYLGMTDVVLCAGASDTEEKVRVVLRRDASTLLDKEAAVVDLAALASGDPLRQRRVPATVLHALSQDVPDLPIDMDWGYFQAAPADQRVPFLVGNEWLLLRGLTVDGLVRSQLPEASAAIWVRPRGGSLDGGYPVTTVADRILIDGAAETVTITWRGAFPLESLDVLSNLVVAAGVHLPEKPIDWSQAAAPQKKTGATTLTIGQDGELSVVMAAPGTVSSEHTSFLQMPDSSRDDDEDDDALDATIGIAQAPVPDDDEEDELEGTIGIAQLVVPEVVTPFPLPQPGARRALAPTPLPGAPWAQHATLPIGVRATVDVPDDPMEATVGLTTLAPTPATPFSGVAAAPTPSAADDGVDLRGATSELSPAEAAVVWAQAGLPFPGASKSPSPPISPWAGGATKPRAPALSLNSQIKVELGITPSPSPPPRAPAPSAPQASASPPEPPARVAGVDAPPPSPPPEAEIDRSAAPAPPKGVSQGEQFLAALAWLSENKKG